MNAVVQQAIEQSVLNVAKQLEDQLDQKIQKLENLDDDDIERLRQRRIDELRRQQERTREWVANGHGEYRELDNEKDFFREIKGEERVVCHFYRESWPCKVRAGPGRRMCSSLARAGAGSVGTGRRSGRRRPRVIKPRQPPVPLPDPCLVELRAQVMDKHMSLLAKKHLETKFVKVSPLQAPLPRRRRRRLGVAQRSTALGRLEPERSAGPGASSWQTATSAAAACQQRSTVKALPPLRFLASPSPT